MNNIIYEVKIKPKMIWRIKTYTIAYVKKQKQNVDILSIMCRVWVLSSPVLSIMP